MDERINGISQECWTQAKDLAVSLFHFFAGGWENHGIGWDIPVKDSAVAVAAHIAAGREGRTRRQSRHSISAAQAAAGELWARLIILRDVGILAEGDFLDLNDRLTRLRLLIKKMKTDRLRSRFSGCA